MTLYALVCVCVCVPLYMYIFVCVCVCVCVMLQAESKAGRIVSVVPVKSSHIQSISSCLIQLMLLLRSSFVLLPPIQCKSPIKLSIQFRMGSILVIAKQSTGLGLIILVLPPSILSSPPPPPPPPPPPSWLTLNVAGLSRPIQRSGSIRLDGWKPSTRLNEMKWNQTDWLNHWIFCLNLRLKHNARREEMTKGSARRRDCSATAAPSRKVRTPMALSVRFQLSHIV